MTLYDEMQAKDPKRNPIFTAIDMLKTDDEIRQFVREYEEFLLANTNDEIRGKEVQVARDNVGYVLGYYSDGVMKQWYAALPSVAHPVFGSAFGRTKDMTPKEAFEAGIRLAKGGK